LTTENNDGTRKSRQLLLLLHVWKDRQINDIGKIGYERAGDVKKFMVIEVEDFFDVKTPASEWGKRLSEIRNRYISILNLGERDRLEIKVL